MEVFPVRRSPMPSTAIGASVKHAFLLLCSPFLPLKRVENDPKVASHLTSRPATRIDIRDLPRAPQPQRCYLLLKLPLELRERIYWHALGGRLITIQIISSPHREFSIIRSQFYPAPDDLAHSPTQEVPPEGIPTAFLFTCRQIYSEALSILHGHNTFHIWANQLEEVVRCALGYHCLPDICNVYIFHPDNMFQGCRWTDVFAILHRMNLRRMGFKFAKFAIDPKFNTGREPGSNPDPFEAVLDTSWGRNVLGLKSRNLRRFELWFAPDASGYSPEDVMYKRELAERLRQQLMITGAGGR